MKTALVKSDAVAQWTLARALYELEKHNGRGYRLFHPHMNSPYLWGFANHYRSGKYVAEITPVETTSTG